MEEIVMEELIKKIPETEYKFINENKEYSLQTYQTLCNIKENNLTEIVYCENSIQRKVVHILSHLLCLYHAKYYKWDQSWKTDNTLDLQCDCESCKEKKRKKYNCQVLGVTVSTNELKLCQSDKKHQKSYNKLYNNYNLVNNYDDDSVPDWLAKRQFKQLKAKI